MTTHWKGVEQYFTVVLNFTEFVILENLSISDLALAGVKGRFKKIIIKSNHFFFSNVSKNTLLYPYNLHALSEQSLCNKE